MKTQNQNAVQSDLKYRKVLRNRDALFHEEKPTRWQMKSLIRMALSCSKSHSLAVTKKKEMKDIADTWQKLLTQPQKERAEK